MRSISSGIELQLYIALQRNCNEVQNIILNVFIALPKRLQFQDLEHLCYSVFKKKCVFFSFHCTNPSLACILYIVARELQRFSTQNSQYTITACEEEGGKVVLKIFGRKHNFCWTPCTWRLPSLSARDRPEISLMKILHPSTIPKSEISNGTWDSSNAIKICILCIFYIWTFYVYVPMSYLPMSLCLT